MTIEHIELTFQGLTPQRIDVFIAENIASVSRGDAQKMVEHGDVTINKHVVIKSKNLVKQDDIIGVKLKTTIQTPITFRSEAFTFPILFEDEHILIINKPANTVVHPAPGHYESGTVVHALLSYLPHLQLGQDESNEDEFRPGIVHRLDKDTSGCLVIAKTKESRIAFLNMFAERTIHKTYLALSYHVPKEREGEIRNLIGRHKTHRQKMAIVERNGKEAITLYQVQRVGRLSEALIGQISLELLTGRTHQIRVHLANLKSPVLGDVVYGGKQPDLAERQMLHAHKLNFTHPFTHEEIELVAPIPADMSEIMNQIQWLTD